MHRKPWPIVIISILFLIIPGFNLVITFLILDLNVPFTLYLQSLLFIPSNWIPLFNMVVPSLVAGVAVYSVKKWTYPIFLITMLWLTFFIFKYASSALSIGDLVFCVGMPMVTNIIFVTYLLQPDVRAVYYNPRLRWWETKPRYAYTGDIQISVNGFTAEGKMANFSEGGVLAMMPISMEANSNVIVNMNFMGAFLGLKARVVHRKSDEAAHGLQFIDLSIEEKKFLFKVAKKLKADKCPITRPLPYWSEDLKTWFVTLVKTGDGLLPVIQAKNEADR